MARGGQGYLGVRAGDAVVNDVLINDPFIIFTTANSLEIFFATVLNFCNGVVCWDFTMACHEVRN